MIEMNLRRRNHQGGILRTTGSPKTTENSHEIREVGHRGINHTETIERGTGKTRKVQDQSGADCPMVSPLHLHLRLHPLFVRLGKHFRHTWIWYREYHNQQRTELRHKFTALRTMSRQHLYVTSPRCTMRIEQYPWEFPLLLFPSTLPSLLQQVLGLHRWQFTLLAFLSAYLQPQQWPPHLEWYLPLPHRTRITAPRRPFLNKRIRIPCWICCGGIPWYGRGF